MRSADPALARIEDALARIERRIDDLAAVVDYLCGDQPMEAVVSLMRRHAMTPREARCMNVLLNARGEIDHSTLSARLGNADEPLSYNGVRKVVSQTRRKLVGSEFTIETIHGLGYRLVRQPAVPDPRPAT